MDLPRPHHILDIVTSHGAGERFEPHPYGHSLHIVAGKVPSDGAPQAWTAVPDH
jgi:hypothetical protein